MGGNPLECSHLVPIDAHKTGTKQEVLVKLNFFTEGLRDSLRKPLLGEN
jgi:hypothetical protein